MKSSLKKYFYKIKSLTYIQSKWFLITILVKILKIGNVILV